MIVVDASLAVKWFRAEAFSLEAVKVYEENAGNILVPDLFAVEVATALVRNANMIKVARRTTEDSLSELAGMIGNDSIRLTRLITNQLRDAATLALDLGHPLKDCIYLALAMEMECDLITCDARFAEKARSVWRRVKVLGD